MDITIQPGLLSGKLTAIPSKSMAHRMMICAAFSDAPTELICRETNRDIEATAVCLKQLGATVSRTGYGYRISPAITISKKAELFCHDSGSTLRFLLPIVGALGVDAVFHMDGRLPERPLSPLWEEMERMGCSLSRPSIDTIRCRGKLVSGEYIVDGSISSQFVTGLLLALALVPGQSCITLTGKPESKPYIAMTQQVMAQFGVQTASFQVSGGRFKAPGTLTVEGDWSNAAFFLAANILGSRITVENLNENSSQGDRAVLELLPLMQNHITVDASDIPDLVPILAVVGSCQKGITFTNIQRLRLKESDRVQAIVEMIANLGGQASATQNTLDIQGTGLLGGTVDSKNDHRIAMAAAIAATVCTRPVTILGAECTQKSYPSFWAEFVRLGGSYEQYVR